MDSRPKNATTTTAAAAGAARRAPLRILCLGDSLTSGWPAEHPYAGRLVAALEAADPGLAVRVDVDGVPGDPVVRGSFRTRMQRRWAEKQYDWTIVLGGANDIGMGHAEAKTIADALETCWSIPLARGAKVLALTIPECAGHRPPDRAKREAVNQALKTYKRRNYYTYDLHEAVTYSDLDPERRQKLWNPDGVHLTAEGYDYMGEQVAAAITKIMHLEEAQNTEISSIVSNARQRRMIEDLLFDEERGDPKLLSQGYIVVRKRDLD